MSTNSVYQIVTDKIISLLEKDIVPWQEVQLPSGELLSMGVVFDDPHKSIALHVKSQQGPILELMTKGHPCLRFVSPKGTDVTIQIHEDE